MEKDIAIGILFAFTLIIIIILTAEIEARRNYRNVKSGLQVRDELIRDVSLAVEQKQKHAIVSCYTCQKLLKRDDVQPIPTIHETKECFESIHYNIPGEGRFYCNDCKPKCDRIKLGGKQIFVQDHMTYSVNIESHDVFQKHVNVWVDVDKNGVAAKDEVAQVVRLISTKKK